MCSYNVRAKLLIIYERNEQTTLTAFLNIIQQITEDETITYTTETNYSYLHENIIIPISSN